MIVLDSTTKKLQIRMSASDVEMVWDVTWAELDQTTQALLSVGDASGLTNDTTDVDMVAAPASGRYRKIMHASVVNVGSFPTTAVEIVKDISGTDRLIQRCMLNLYDALQYDDGEGWRVVDASGQVKQSTGAPASGLGLAAYQAINGSDGMAEHYFVPGMAVSTALVATSLTANILRAFPFAAPYWPCVLDMLAWTVATGAAGNGRIGLYANREGYGEAYPGSLITGSGDISTAVAAVKTFSINTQLVPGRLYWLAHVQSAAITTRCLSVAQMFPSRGIDLAGSVNPNFGISRAFTYAALPDPWGSGGAPITAVPIPALGYRIAS
jgi:hypothetical protein